MADGPVSRDGTIADCWPGPFLDGLFFHVPDQGTGGKLPSRWLGAWGSLMMPLAGIGVSYYLVAVQATSGKE